jgi:thiamine monophosphate kinase
LFTVPERKVGLLPKSFQGVRLTAIGKITRNQELLVLEENGRAEPLVPGGWDPFRKEL